MSPERIAELVGLLALGGVVVFRKRGLSKPWALLISVAGAALMLSASFREMAHQGGFTNGYTLLGLVLGIALPFGIAWVWRWASAQGDSSR